MLFALQGHNRTKTHSHMRKCCAHVVQITNAIYFEILVNSNTLVFCLSTLQMKLKKKKNENSFQEGYDTLKKSSLYIG
jgi:hypothetical protein